MFDILMVLIMKNIKLMLEEEDFRPAFVFDDVNGLLTNKSNVHSDKAKQIVFKDVQSVHLDQEALKIVSEPKQNKFVLPSK